MRCSRLVVASVLCLTSAPVWASALPPSDPQAAAPGLADAPATADSTAPPTTAATPSLSADEMSALHAGSETQVTVLTNQQLSGATSGNTINAGALSSGQVTFSQQALSGFAGVGNFVVNTGANNTLQGAINISIVGAPVP